MVNGDEHELEDRTTIAHLEMKELISYDLKAYLFLSSHRVNMRSELEGSKNVLIYSDATCSEGEKTAGDHDGTYYSYSEVGVNEASDFCEHAVLFSLASVMQEEEVGEGDYASGFSL